ncbi:hypothetical protein SACE_5110 [Saccharopolyspora erythraea NRRL 2338]|uniref:CRISPR-associated protein Csx10 n=1 Tax=Saccharopolyspora erythraea (strain ATCC 11635 / DSM 40517 / JCM 4748 / NBRC 13426 / NCIMB 8594 / NRRL 2338) TaxID=405948 RepID=A4FJY5_SACEN|nr:hypothetical protein SACE_5110 [Saccharopolyspora erythraea NRRL 2338]
MARITVTLLEPMAAGKRLRADFLQDTYDHVPGTVVRGALAGRWINERGVEVTTTEEFLDVFEGDGAFGPLHNENSLPAPLSVKVHKYAAKDDCPRLWWDRAASDGEQEHCKCGQALEDSKGESTGSVARQRRTRAALDEDGVVREGQLFTQNSLQRDTRFSGWLHGPAVRALWIVDQPVDTVYLGGRLKHQGAAVVQVDTEVEPEPVEQRGNKLILRLLGPGAFVDKHGFPSVKPDLDELTDVLQVEAQAVENCWTRWCEVEGWHAASGLPKPVERAVQPGSTYVIRLERAADEQARKRLMARGIGLRRREGFGALYSVKQEPLTVQRLVQGSAPLRNPARLRTDVPLLRQRYEQMLRGEVDDTMFQESLTGDGGYEKALRRLLNVVEPTLFYAVLTDLESHR